MVFTTAADIAAYLGNCSREKVERFYDECSAQGLPLADAAGCATFLWLEPESSTADAVLMRMNRISDKGNLARGLMERVPGTDLWALTLELPPTLRASYCFVPISGEVPATTPPPEHGVYPGLLDPGNRMPHCGADAQGRTGWSVYSGPLASPQDAWQADHSHPVNPRHGVETLQFSSGPRQNHLYLPPAGGGEATLVVLTDAETWFTRLLLHHALDRAISRGQLPPVVVAGPECVSKQDRLKNLGANPEFVHDLAGTVVPWARRRAADEGIELAAEQAILVGQSLGGLTALLALIEAPGIFSGIVAQSPSLWWSPENPRSPAGWKDRPTDWLTDRLLEYSMRHAERPTRIELSVGEQEGFSIGRIDKLGSELAAAGWSTHLRHYDGGHDHAWWRGGLVDALASLLGDGDGGGGDGIDQD